MTDLEGKRLQLNAVYANHCAAIGDRKFRIGIIEQEVEELIIKLRNLNVEAKAIDKEIDKEAKVLKAVPPTVIVTETILDNAEKVIY